MTIYALDGISPQFPEAGTYWIAPDATLIGDVRVAAQVSIWFGAVLRGDTEPIVIGEGSNIQENTVIHTDPGCPVDIGRNCTIGHKAMIHGCTIGDGVLVGMGATILNGARIGAGSLIGAGALVTEGKEIPEGSLVLGMPGKVVGPVGDERRAGNLASAESYRQRLHRYLNGLEELDQ